MSGRLTDPPLPDSFAAPDTFARQFSAIASAPEATLHTATVGADTLLATGDADVFAWSLADHTAQDDLLVGFNPAADAIDITDLLGDSVHTTDLSSHLDVSLDGNSTVLKISNTDDFDHAEQVITVQDVNLFEGIDLSDSAAFNTALQNMVDAGKLVTDSVEIRCDANLSLQPQWVAGIYVWRSEVCPLLNAMRLEK